MCVASKWCTHKKVKITRALHKILLASIGTVRRAVDTADGLHIENHGVWARHGFSSSWHLLAFYSICFLGSTGMVCVTRASQDTGPTTRACCRVPPPTAEHAYEYVQRVLSFGADLFVLPAYGACYTLEVEEAYQVHVLTNRSRTKRHDCSLRAKACKKNNKNCFFYCFPVKRTASNVTASNCNAVTVIVASDPTLYCCCCGRNGWFPRLPAKKLEALVCAVSPTMRW